MNTIETFVEKYKDRSINTVRNYRETLNKYFNTINKKPNQAYFKQTEEEIKKDILTYWETIKKNAPKTRNTRVFCIKSFLMRNGIELKTMFYRDLLDSIKEKGAITQTDVITTDDIRKVLRHGNEKDRAIILTLATSGMRIGELLKIKEENLYLDHDPPYIYLPGKITKNGYKRFTFCTHETKEALETWLKVKKDYIKRVKHKNHLPYAVDRDKDENDPRLFPFCYAPVSKQWRKYMKIIGRDERDTRTKRMKITIHSLRSFANTKLGNTMPDSKKNFIIGHTTYMSKEYDKYKEEDIKDDYVRAMNDLAILEPPRDIKQINDDIETLKQENKELKEDNQRVRNRLQDYDIELRNILRQLDKKGIKIKK